MEINWNKFNKPDILVRNFCLRWPLWLLTPSRQKPKYVSGCMSLGSGAVNTNNIHGTWLALCILFFFFFVLRRGPARATDSSFLRFEGNTQRRTAAGRTPLDERSARRRDLYLTITTLETKSNMPLAGFEPTILADERPQTYALDRAATGTGFCVYTATKIWSIFWK